MKQAPEQLDLLAGEADASGRLPDGVRYGADLLTAEEEAEAARLTAALDLQPFAFRGFLGHRRTASFGWRYDFNGGGFGKAAPIPPAFLPYRDKAAVLAGLPAEAFEHMLAVEYAPGAGIGWHRDRPQFGTVVALSLLAPCRLRFRRRVGEGYLRRAQLVAPRSGYVLSGAGRDVWEHSIPPLDTLRYSLTFRTLRLDRRSQTKPNQSVIQGAVELRQARTKAGR